MNDMKKHIYLVVGLVALYLAAQEYGVKSLDDVKKLVSPLLKMVDIDKLTDELADTEA
jgi:hypothetical protein